MIMLLIKVCHAAEGYYKLFPFCTLKRACNVSKISFKSVAGQAGSESSDAIMDFSSSNDSCGLCIQINPLITIARTYTHSHATVVLTTSMSEASMPAIVSLPPAALDTPVVLRIPTEREQRMKEMYNFNKKKINID